MNDIKIKFSYLIDASLKGLEEYFKTIDGVEECSVNLSEESIRIKYNDKLNVMMIVNEIKLYSKEENDCFIAHFEKYVDDELGEYIYHTDDLCCEYCYMGALYELIQMDEIVCVNTDFGWNEELGYESYFDVDIKIKYIKSKWTEESEKKIKEVFE